MGLESGPALHDAVPPAPPRIGRLIGEDYRAFADLRGDSALRRRLLMMPRILLNPSLHAVVIIRLSNASPRWLHWFWRNLMMWKHSMDIGYRPTIGPGLILPHPIGIVIGRDVRIGRRVTIMHNVSVGPNIGAVGLPEIGDRCVLLANCMIFGDIEIGAGSVVGAGASITFDVPPDSVAQTESVREGAREKLGEVIPGP